MRILEKLPQVKEMTYTTCCLLDYPYFKDNYKMIAIDLSKQQALDADSRKIQQINFTANLDTLQCSLLLSKEKKIFLNYLQGTVKILKILIHNNMK